MCVSSLRILAVAHFVLLSGCCLRILTNSQLVISWWGSSDKYVFFIKRIVVLRILFVTSSKNINNTLTLAVVFESEIFLCNFHFNEKKNMK